MDARRFCIKDIKEWKSGGRNIANRPAEVRSVTSGSDDDQDIESFSWGFKAIRDFKNLENPQGFSIFIIE
jgi:hypothetical protein